MENYWTPIVIYLSFFFVMILLFVIMISIEKIRVGDYVKFNPHFLLDKIMMKTTSPKFNNIGEVLKIIPENHVFYSEEHGESACDFARLVVKDSNGTVVVAPAELFKKVKK